MGLLEVLDEYIVVSDDEVSIREFIESPDYLGMGDQIYEFWKDELNGLETSISELILTGSLGGGKSMLGAVYIIYRLFLLFRKGNPHEIIGIRVKDAPIEVLYFSLSLTLAKQSGFQYLFMVVDNCKWFQENCPRDKARSSEIYFPKYNFTIHYASAEGHQIGLNVWGFILDEANFRKAPKNADPEFTETYRLTQQLLDRQMSRFVVDGELRSLAVFISSASYESAFIEKRKELAISDKKAKVITAVTYKLQPEKYSKETFTVFIGAGQLDPCIVEDENHMNAIKSQLGMIDEMANMLFEYPPVTLKKSFELNVRLAIQNHCGRSTNVKGTFFTNSSLLTTAYQFYRENPNQRSPMAQSSIVLSNKDSSEISDICNFSLFENPDMPRSLFLDLSISGDYGSLACTRFEGKNAKGLKMHANDFVLEIIPPESPAVIMIRKVYNFVMELSQHINVVAMGSDQFQCLAKGTLVPTKRGIIPVEDVVEGDILYTHNGECTVLSISLNTNEKFVIYKTKRGKAIQSTEKHRHSVIKWGKEGTVLKEKSGKKQVRVLKTLEIGDNLEPLSSCEIKGVPILVKGEPFKGEILEFMGLYLSSPYVDDKFSCKFNKNELEKVSKHIRKWSNYGIFIGRDNLIRFVPYDQELLSCWETDFDKMANAVYSLSTKDVATLLKGFYSGAIHHDGSFEVHMDDKRKLDVIANLTRVHFGIDVGCVKSWLPGHFLLKTYGSLENFSKIGTFQNKEYIIRNGRMSPDRVVSLEEPLLSGELITLMVDSEDHTFYTVNGLTENSSQIRQDINADLGLADIRVSLDSTDVPFILWTQMLIESRFKMRYYPRLDREIKEAGHDFKRRRVFKRDGSTDDQFQALVGSVFLSETVASELGDLDGIDHINIVGQNSAEKLIKSLGYFNHKLNKK